MKKIKCVRCGKEITKQVHYIIIIYIYDKKTNSYEELERDYDCSECFKCYEMG